MPFAFNCYVFGRLIFQFNHSKMYLSSSKKANEHFLLNRFLPNVPHVSEYLFSENFCDFLNFLIFYYILVIILLILSKYNSTFTPYRIQTIFVADCFHRRFSCFWYYPFSYKIFWFSYFCCSFCGSFVVILW